MRKKYLYYFVFWMFKIGKGNSNKLLNAMQNLIKENNMFLNFKQRKKKQIEWYVFKFQISICEIQINQK